jgi:hypothetical protein
MGRHSKAGSLFAFWRGQRPGHAVLIGGITAVLSIQGGRETWK